MSKFYSDINKVNCKYLLEATPYRIDSKVNFSHQLDEKTFFQYLFKDADDGMYRPENELFNRKVDDALIDVYNKFAKVEMINIAGYGGCGKTTFVRHLLWKLNNEKKFTYEVVDYEGVNTADEPLLERISARLEKLNDRMFCSFIQCVAKEEIMNMSRFHNYLGPILELIYFMKNLVEKRTIKNYLRDQKLLFDKMEDFLVYLFILDFIMLLYEEYRKEGKSEPIIILIDNVDSLSDLHEESMLISATKDFITNCNFFFGQNLDNNCQFEGKSIKELIDNTKLVFFLTTRIATIKRYKELYPDLENLYGWNSMVMPEHYYDHRAIINTRINYYLQQEGELDSETVKKLIIIRELSEVAYSNYNFKRLFNGNIRFCIERLCDITTHYDNTGTIEQCVELYKMRNKIPEAASGANGILLAMILSEFKNNSIYRDKLQLSECKQDNEVSLSRIILTILREKGNRCTMLELYNLLSPFFKVEDISKEVWALNEVGREIWRRLLLFNVKFPRNSTELLNQGEEYVNSNVEINAYSEVSICRSGIAYIDFVVPHFEFMLSRRNHSIELLNENRYKPLFDEINESLINVDGFKYRFEKKISWVYNDVRDCCYNSVHFSDKICRYYDISRDEYINNTVYNYMAQAQDGTARFKQSYESRLIFSHIGYIERYRRYLLKKYNEKSEIDLADINERIIRFIKKYLELYINENICYQTEIQNRAAKELFDAIQKIKQADFKDFTTKIETSKDLSTQIFA